jgi:hypothetical protein
VVVEEDVVGADEVGAGLDVLAEDEADVLGAELLVLGAELEDVLGSVLVVDGALVVGAVVVTGALLLDEPGPVFPTCDGASQPSRLLTVTYAGAVLRVLYTATPTDPGAITRAADSSV